MRIQDLSPFLSDNITGTSGIDVIYGYEGNDVLRGEGGADILDGGEGDDEIHGGEGNDRIVGGKGSDDLFGDTHNDTFIQHNAFGGDFIHGGDGFDTVDYNSATSQFSVKFSFGQLGFDGKVVMTIERSPLAQQLSPTFELATEWTDTVRSIESVITGRLGDTVTGNEHMNTISTMGGDDIIRGRGGIDDMDGGAGNDTFIYESWDESERIYSDFSRSPGGDLIRNFGDAAGNQDVIDLRAVDANRDMYARGNEDFRADDRDGEIETGELFITERFDSAQDKIVSVVLADTDGNGGHDFAIRFDRVIETLGVSDFIL